jgi:hypothetical protein
MVGCVTAACAASAPPPVPPPFAGAPPGAPAELGVAPEAAVEALRSASAAEQPASPPPGARTDAVPEPILSIEPPFRLDRRVFPPTRAAFLADLADRTRWNKGGMGTLRAEPPPVPGHPAPKVILDVPRVKGALTAAEAQRVLRFRFWIKAVECFGLGAYKNQGLRGAASLSVTVLASGKVQHAALRETSFAEDDVNRCLADKMRGMTLPKARGASTFTVELQIGHGDEPIAPPAALLVPGDGELSPDAIRRIVEAALPVFEACYKEALAYAPELWGRLGIRFHVTEKGKTDEAFEVESRFPDERVTLCALRAARKLTFPKPTGGDMRFIVPLRFRTPASPASGG